MGVVVLPAGTLDCIVVVAVSSVADVDNSALISLLLQFLMAANCASV